MKPEWHKRHFNRAAQLPLEGSVATATVFIDRPARFPFLPPATYNVKVENTYKPEAIRSNNAADAALLLAQPARL
jgi:hypothetical protein